MGACVLFLTALRCIVLQFTLCRGGGGQHRMRTHEIQSAIILMVEFSKIYYTR
jgi:hypothetical protein